ncbi:MAG: PD-(D/E)XK nuclease family protein [Planctomycetota bacterium]
MSNLLTNSRLRTWRDCKRRHRLLYLDGWRPRREDDAVSFGRLAHLGLEGWWKAAPEQRLYEAMLRISGRAHDLFQEAAVRELLRAYDERYAGTMEGYDVLAVEATFTAPLLNPETGAASRTFLLAGKVDGIVRERATGRVLLLEHKTTSEAIEDATTSYWRRLAMDGQVSHYYVGAESLGHRVEGCLYDVLLRPRLKPLKATPEASRKYTKDGRLYAAQREVDETPEEYAARLRADIAEAPAKYFQRREVPRTEDDLRDYLFDAWAEARAMREAELAARSPRNPEACHRFGQCAFWDSCANGLRLEDYPEQFERVHDVHPELDLEAPHAS